MIAGENPTEAQMPTESNFSLGTAESFLDVLLIKW